jgi:DNA-directed RNA polymerase specialized sigma24 family protein
MASDDGTCDRESAKNCGGVARRAIKPVMPEASTMDDHSDPGRADAAGSMTVLLQNWAGNEDRIAERIDGEFLPRLRRLAHRVLGHLPGAAAEADDVVQSAIKSLCLYMRRQSDGQNKDRNDVWRLLCHIAARKASRRRQRQTRGLRGGRVHPFSDFGGPDDFANIEELLQEVPPGEFDLDVQEAVERLDAALQPIALLVMEGRSQSDISALLGCSRRTVIRKFELVKVLLRASLEPGDSQNSD